MGRDVGDGILQRGNDGHAEFVVEIFSVKVAGGGGNSGNDGGCGRVQVQFHRGHAGGRTAVHQPLLEHRQEGGGHVPVDQQGLLGVADAGAAGFGILHDVQGHLQVGGGVHIHVADPRPGLDAGHGGLFHAGPDQPRPAPGDQQIHQAVGGHQFPRAGMAGVFHQADGALRQAHLAQPGPQRLHDGVAGGPGFFAAAQHTGAARLQGQGRRVAGHVGAALVDNGDHAHGHGGLFDQQAVGTHDLAQHGPYRVGQGGDFAHALGHVGQAARRQRQTVQHHVAHLAAGSFQVALVGRQDLVLRGDQGHRHRFQRGVLGVGVGKGQRQAGRLRGLQDLLRSHGQTSFCPMKRVPTGLPSRIS